MALTTELSWKFLSYYSTSHQGHVQNEDKPTTRDRRNKRVTPGLSAFSFLTIQNLTLIHQFCKNLQIPGMNHFSNSSSHHDGVDGNQTSRAASSSSIPSPPPRQHNKGLIDALTWVFTVVFLKTFGKFLGLVMSRFSNSSSQDDGGDAGQTSRASPSSTLPSRKNYEVFLSFRGEDTRHDFTSHLYHRLVNKGIEVFKDDRELDVGENIEQLFEAIKASKISIPIISPNYASSIWCLKELLQILECKKNSGQLVRPIFYKVKPSDIRERKGHFGGQFRECMRKHGHDGKLVRELEIALEEVTSLKGWESNETTNRDKGELVEIVVQTIFNELKKAVLDVPDFLIGVGDHRENIVSMINANKSNGAKVIGIHGMGGIGKTTLGKVLYNALSNDYKCRGFVPNIREASLQHKGMEGLQKLVISDVLADKSLREISHVDEGKAIIEQRFKGKKLLLLLDDVEKNDQLDKLGVNANCFGADSIVIITTRIRDVIEAPVVNTRYELNELDNDQSYELFCKHAFERDASCPIDLEVIASDIISMTGGLPLAIEVIGSSLRGKGEDFWKDTRDKLKRMPEKEVQDKLKISYDALDKEQKEIFLDIACLPIGNEPEFASYMWKSCNFYPEHGISKLISLSLIKRGEQNHLTMHDQLKSLGMGIVYREAWDEIGKRSRIWTREEAMEVLEEMQGTPKVQALRFGSPWGEDAHYTSQQFERMTRVRFLQMQGVQLTGNFENLFLYLRWLRWGCHPIFSGCIDIVGINFKPKRLVVLQLSNCNVTEHWTGWREMKCLKVLELDDCHELNTTPNFSAMEELDVLVLRNCRNLREIDSSIGKFSKSLKVLDVYGCWKLKELPKEVGKMEELKILDIGSTRVREIPIFEGYLTKLERFSATKCGMLTELPKSIGKLDKLQILEVTQSSRVPESIGMLKLLTELDLSFSGFTKLPDSIGDLYNLEYLSMFGLKIEVLPTSIGKLHKLQKLKLQYCRELKEIPESIGMLKLLTELHLRNTRVTKLPDSIGDLYNLGKLSMASADCCIRRQERDCSCASMKKIPEWIGKLKLLTELHLSLRHVTELPHSIGDLRDLKRLCMYDCDIEYLPTSIGELNKLRKLDLKGCSLLKRIPESIGKLKSLTMLGLRGTRVTKLPDSIGDLYNLEKLSMFGSRIECLPTSIGMLHKLQKLDLRRTGITQLPDSIGGLYNLEELFMSDTCIKCLPTSIAMLTKLQRLDFEGCKELESLPNLPCSLAFISFNGDSMETLPDFSNLTNLTHLTYKDMFQRRSRELNLGKLNRLWDLNIHDSKLAIRKDNPYSNFPRIYVFDSTEGIDMSSENFRLLLELPLSVKRLEVIGCQTLCTLPNLSTLKNLSGLHLQKCSKLEEINGLEGAESLINVHIAGCHPEIKIPDLSMLRNLKHLTINNDKLMKIPWLQDLKSLENLNISGCKSLDYLPDLSQLTNLQSLDIRGCTEELRMSLDLPRVKITSGPLEEQEESENDSNPHEDDA